MARARNLKPGFFTNEDLATFPPLTRLLFAGLWTVADREGRLEDRPLRIKALVLPYDNCNVDKMLSQLASGGFVLRYAVDGRKYIQINAFAKHQNPHVKEQASTIPAPESTVQVPGNPEQAGPLTSSLIPSSLIPDSPIPHTESSAPPMFDADEAFEEIWKDYPNKDGKRAALRHFTATVKSADDMVRIRNALRNYLASDRVRNGFVKNGSTWFNGWTDWEHYTEDGNGTDHGSGHHRGARAVFTPDGNAAIADKVARIEGGGAPGNR